MKRVLFVVIPEKGHINPYIAPAAALRDRGHTVGFYAVCDVSEQLERAGFSIFYSGQEDCPPPPDENRGKEFASNVQNQTWLRNWIKNLLVDKVPQQIPVLRSIIRDFQPDVLVIDPMVYQGAIAADLEGLPWVGISSSLNPIVPDSLKSELIATNHWLADSRDTLFRSHGTKGTFRVCDCLSPYLNIVFSTKEFIGREVPRVKLLGSSIPNSIRGDEQDFPWDKLSNTDPIIYMSLGSQIYHQPEMFRKVIDAARDKSVQLILSVNELLNTAQMENLPSNTIAVHYTPQLTLLPRVQAMITHGGANSVMEALTFGVPLLITPLCNDQFHQAYFLEQSGAGICLDLNTATSAECWFALNQLLSDKRIKKSSELIKESYARNGGKEAALLIEQLLKERESMNVANFS